MSELALSYLTLVALGAALTFGLTQWAQVRLMLWSVYGIHVMLGSLIEVASFVPAPDVLHYQQIAAGQLAYWNGGSAFAPSAADGKEGWTLALAGVYWLFGDHPIYGVLLNAMMATATAALLARTCQLLGWGPAASRAVGMMLLPGLLLWSSIGLREAGVWMFTAMTLYAAVCLIQGRTTTAVVVGTAGIVGLGWFRGSVTVPLVAGVAVGAFAAWRRTTALSVVASGLVLIAVIGPSASLLRQFGLEHLEQVNRSRESLSSASSGFQIEAYSGLGGLVRSLPGTLPRVIAGPFPWEWPSVGLLGVFAWVAWAWLLWMAILGFGTRRGVADGVSNSCCSFGVGNRVHLGKLRDHG